MMIDSEMVVSCGLFNWSFSRFYYCECDDLFWNSIVVCDSYSEKLYWRWLWWGSENCRTTMDKTNPNMEKGGSSSSNNDAATASSSVRLIHWRIYIKRYYNLVTICTWILIWSNSMDQWDWVLVCDRFLCFGLQTLKSAIFFLPFWY